MSAFIHPSTSLIVTKWRIDTKRKPPVAIVHLEGGAFLTVSDPADSRAFIADLTAATGALEAAQSRQEVPA